MPKGMRPIFTQLVPTGTSAIAFNNIPQTYNDLLLKISIRGTWTQFDSVGLIFNGNQFDRSRNVVQGSGSSASTSISTYRDFGAMGGTNTTSNVYSSFEIYIPSYTKAFFHQCIINGVTENNATEGYCYLTSFIDLNNFPITSLSISSSTSGLPLGAESTMTLYGIGR
jgi:hypothetical protein